MSLQLIPIESGWLGTETANLCTGATGRCTIPVSSWLIDHPKGLVLFDTGLHGDLVTSAKRLGPLSELFEVTMSEDLGSAMQRRGFDPAVIDLIVFSHLHFDHSGGTHTIPNARIIVQQDEWDIGHDPRFVEPGIYAPNDYDLGHDVLEVNGTHDVFGDGRLVCVPTPGHTAGHQSLRVELDTGPVLLVGDCCYWASMLENTLLPPFAFDESKQLASMAQLKALQDDGVLLIFGHDREQWESFKGKTLL